jgi:SulP family sulfate permease
MMVILQFRTLVGLPPSNESAADLPLRQLFQVIGQLSSAHREPLILGAIVIIVATLVARRWPRSPSVLVGVALSVIAALSFGWRERTVGAVPFAMPPFAVFTWKPSDLTVILPSALGLAIVTAVNVLITSRVVEHFQGRHRGLRPADADAELGAYGIANLCAGTFGAPMSVGIPARSVANVRCGGSTRLSILLHALVLLGLVRFGSTLIATIPMAALAGVTAYVGLSLLEWSTWRRLPRMKRTDAAAFLVTAAAVLATTAVAAVAIGWSLHASGNFLVKSAAIPGLVARGRIRAIEPHKADT